MFRHWKIGCGLALAAALFTLGLPHADAQGPRSAPGNVAALEAQLELLKEMTAQVERKLKAARESEKRPEPGKGMPGRMGRGYGNWGPGFGMGGPGFGKGPGGMGPPAFGKMDEKRMAEMRERMEQMMKRMEESMRGGEKGRPDPKGKERGKEQARPTPDKEKDKGREREMQEQRAIRERLEKLMREVEELRRNLRR
jgi:hypothetical protein